MSAPIAAVDVLLPLRDEWIAAHPEQRRCLRCAHKRLLHVDGRVCFGDVAEGCRCTKFADSWVNQTPGEFWR